MSFLGACSNTSFGEPFFGLFLAQQLEHTHPSFIPCDDEVQQVLPLAQQSQILLTKSAVGMPLLCCQILGNELGCQFGKVVSS